ncbi:hypothetical protein GWK47_012513 [Chionoecetes opilio]|uniref:Condensation domain-containing protein n=1 Tax=Chionoecetes opilio TaxID=41210 RepID=A0A8J4Y5E9_CHIOP|nr:hypothetical protein GWK47_012513 [Chionoecetes opilio]
MYRTAAHGACRVWAAASLPGHTTPRPTLTAPHRPPSLARPITTTIKPAGDEGVRWRFPADDNVKGMVARVENGLSQTIILTLNASSAITHDLMEEVLVHLYEKVESLRVCLRPRQGQLWVADMLRRKLDFKSVNGSDLEEQHSAFRYSPFNLHDGPLWKARLMPCPEDTPCPIPEVKAAFPHQCHLLLSVHHAANDGAVLMCMTQLLVNILDSLLQGVPVTSQQVGELRDGVEARKEEGRMRAALQQNPDKLVEALRQHLGSQHLPLLMEAFGVPNVANATTQDLAPVILDNQTMEKFANKCRSLGATTNAAFTALINASLVEVVREAGMHRDVYNISSRHPVDCRRLIKDCESLPLGNHAIPMPQNTVTPSDVKQHFWQYVKHLDIELRDKLRRNYMCEDRMLAALMRPRQQTHGEQRAPRQLPCWDYTFTNLYSPRTAHHAAGKCVQVTAAVNYMGFHNERFAYGVGMFSFRGQPRLQLQFSTSAISREVAQRCLKKILALFHDVSRN